MCLFVNAVGCLGRFVFEITSYVPLYILLLIYLIILLTYMLSLIIQYLYLSVYITYVSGFYRQTLFHICVVYLLVLSYFFSTSFYVRYSCACCYFVSNVLQQKSGPCRAVARDLE